jgi:hypothetical protein
MSVPSDRLRVVLTDLDEVDWAGLTHAYGPADDVPELLRDLAGGDDDALYALYGNIWHQGTVYEATAYAVPFLIEILDAPDAGRSGVLGLLTSIADGRSYLDVHRSLLPRSEQDTDEVADQIAIELTSVRAAVDAVGAGLATYLRLLDTDADETVRAAATQPMPACGASAVPALERVVADDASPLVRAAAILALSACRAPVHGYLTDPSPLPRVMAAVLVLATGDADDAVAEIVEHDAPTCFEQLKRLPVDIGDPANWVIDALDRHGDLQVRLVTAWMRHPDAAIRSEAVFAAERPLHRWRSAATQLVPALADALSDPSEDVRRWAGNHLAGAGRATAPVADTLWAAVVRGPVVHNTAGASALTALSRLHDPRADGFLADRLSTSAGISPDDGLGPAIKALDGWSTQCRAVIADAIVRAAAGNARIGLITAAGRIGVAPADLVPVLRRQAASHPHSASRVLGDLGSDAVAALPELAGLRTHSEAIVRINAERAIWRITGDVTDLLPVLAGEIKRYHALEVLAEVGPAGAALADRLPAMFDGNDEWRATGSAVAYWRITGDATPVIPVLVRYAACGPRGLVAVNGLTEIGPAAPAAIPLLRAAIAEPARQPRWASSDMLIIEDETWIDACTRALAAIAPPPS